MGLENKNESFEYLIEKSKTKMYKTAMAILKNDDDACDAIQDALLSAYKNFDNLREKQYFSTWIIRILINKCYDTISKNKKVININQQLEKNNNDSYYDFYKEESLLETTLSQIDSDLKIVTVLYYYDDFSIKDISNALNIPEGTVKSRLSRARNQIYEVIKREEVI